MGQGLSPESGGHAGRPVSKIKLEKRLEAKLLREVKKLGGLAIKLPAAWYVGIPDRMLLLPGGQIYFVELKRDYGKPRPKQARWIRRLRRLGFDARVVAGEKELQEYIDELYTIGQSVRGPVISIQTARSRNTHRKVARG